MRMNIVSKNMKFAVGILACLLLPACSYIPKLNSSYGITSKTSRKEYFPESKFGTKASPRVHQSVQEKKQHNGRYVKLSSAYKLNGKWYYPKKNYKNFSQIGRASWYGEAFQGRLTANGEVYDMNSLSAAHPTMPLPSYARVTNLYNGSSVIVRVNDRGPYVSNRIIDLSKRAAELLRYKSGGLAKVKIQYIGPAPLNKDDSRYLLASYRSGRYMNDNIMLARTQKPSIKSNMLAYYKPTLPKTGPVLSFKNMY